MSGNFIECRICLEGSRKNDPLTCPCKCTGSQAFVHKSCLKEWITARGYTSCNICKAEYTGLSLRKRSKTFLDWIREEPEGVGVLIVGLIIFTFLFYVLEIGLIQYWTSSNVVASHWRILLIALVIYYTVLSFLMLLTYTLSVAYIFLTWKRTHFAVTVDNSSVSNNGEQASNANSPANATQSQESHPS